MTVGAIPQYDFCEAIYMKRIKADCFRDEICGRECCDYVREFCPHRLVLLRDGEDSGEIFDADESVTLISGDGTVKTLP